MIGHIAALVDARELLMQWTVRTVRARYQQSMLGWLWAVVQPAAQAAVFTVVFTRFVSVDTGGTPYAAFAYVATVAWAFLVASLTDMSNAVVDNMNLVNKIYFPREVLPLAAMLARLFDFAVAAVLFVGVAVYFELPLFLPGLLLLPVIVAVQMLLVLGIGLTCAALNVFVRDVRSLLLLGTQVWLYASPVIYPVEAVPVAWRAWYRLNPMVGIIEAYRDVLLHGRMPDSSFVVATLVALATFFFGYWLFKRVEFKFADLV